MMQAVYLRAVTDADLGVFFEQQLDPQANQMAAFTSPDPRNRAAFDAHWARIRADERIRIRTLVVDGRTAGYLACFERAGAPEVTYWLGREFWGRGAATQGLRLLLAEEPRRPLFGRAAADNHASRRVLEKCGFRLVGLERSFASARLQEIDEVILILDWSPAGRALPTKP